MKYDLFLRVEGGKIQRKLNIPDGAYSVKFYSRKSRSHNQNSYYWMCLDLILDGLHEIGYNEVRDKNDVHELLKQMFLKRRIVNEQTGEVIGELSRSTTELTKDEFSEYLDRIGQWCAEYLGFPLPEPDSQLKMI